MALSYEVALWGGIQKVNEKVETNKEILSRLLSVFTARQKIESDVSVGMTKVMRKWRYDEPEGPTFHAAMASQKEHSEYLPTIHNELTEFVLKDLLKPIDQFLKDLRNQQSKLLNDHSLLSKELKRKTDDLIKSKQEYFKLFQAHKEAQAVFAKSKTDPLFPAKQLSKMSSNMSKQEKQSNDAHKTYQSTISSFHKFQVSFESQMKGILRSFQELDEKCLNFIQNILKIFLEKQLLGLQKIARYDQNFNTLAASLDVGDITRFIESSGTGQRPDALVEYEQYVSKVRPAQTNQPAAASSGSSQGGSLFARRTGSTSQPAVTAFTRGSGSPDPETNRMGMSGGADDGDSSSSQSEDTVPVASSPSTPTHGSRLASWRQSTVPAGAAELKTQNPAASTTSVSTSPLPAATTAAAAAPAVASLPAAVPDKKTAVAIFDYEAADANEIGFKVGDIIVVHSEHDSGWWTGEIGGRTGMFPAPYVKLTDGEGGASSPAAASPAAVTLERRQCAFVFQATESNELSMEVGDIVEIISTHGDWYQVRNERGESGLIPGNYTQPYP